jgi:2-C-methyl-D-erythritol 2,4-cyclodiphosphate synthase
VIAEAPKLAPHVGEIRRRVAALLGISPDAVSVRGTSSNGLGFAGRGEGIAVMAVVLLNRIPDHKSQITNHKSG